jgi:hypothetical protein
MLPEPARAHPAVCCAREHGKRSMPLAMSTFMSTMQTTNTFKHGQDGSQVSTTNRPAHLAQGGDRSEFFIELPPGPESRGLNTNTNTLCQSNRTRQATATGLNNAQARTFGSGGRPIRIFHRTAPRARKSRLSKNNRTESREPRANPNNTSRPCSTTPNKTVWLARGPKETDSRCATRSGSSSSNALPATRWPYPLHHDVARDPRGASRSAEMRAAQVDRACTRNGRCLSAITREQYTVVTRQTT